MERWCPWCAIQNICGTLHPDNATRPCRGPWKYYFHGFLRKLLWIPWGPHGIPWESHGIPWGFNKIPWNPIRFLGDPGGIPSDPNGGSKFQVGNTAFLRGGGKSGKKMFFLAHPPLGDPPGPLGGSFQRGHQNTPISILKLPFELLSSCAFQLKVSVKV